MIMVIYLVNIKPEINEGALKLLKLVYHLTLLIVFLYSINVYPIGNYSSRGYQILTDENNYITTNKDEGIFTISESGKSASLVVSSQDFPGVINVAKLLVKDIMEVTSVEPLLQVVQQGKKSEGKEIILIGTLGKSQIIDELVKEQKINVEEIKDKCCGSR